MKNRRKRLLAVALLASASLALTGCTNSFFSDAGEVNSVDAGLSQQFDEAINSALTLAGADNAIVGIWSSSGDFVQSYGESVSTGSAIRAAQASQPVMCALLLELVENGTVSLDRKVSKDMPRQVGIEGITFGMLCDATSGLADFKPELTTIFANNPTRPWSDRELLAHSLANSPLAKPGAEQFISDSNALLLGRALSDATGLSLDVLLKTHVFDNAAMGSTFYPEDVITDVQLPGGGMNGFTYPFENGEPVCTVSTPVEGGAEGEVTETPVTPTEVREVSPSMLQGAGATVTTVQDLKKFYETYLSAGFGTAENAALITTESSTPPKQAEGESSPVPAWTFGLEQHGTLYGMSGAMTGTLTAVYHDPSSSFTIVVALNNSSAGANFVRALAFQLSALAGADVSWSAEDMQAQLTEGAVCQPVADDAEEPAAEEAAPADE